MLPNLTNQYISYSMAIFSANEIRTFFIGVKKKISYVLHVHSQADAPSIERILKAQVEKVRISFALKSAIE